LFLEEKEMERKGKMGRKKKKQKTEMGEKMLLKGCLVLDCLT